MPLSLASLAGPPFCAHADGMCLHTGLLRRHLSRQLEARQGHVQRSQSDRFAQVVRSAPRRAGRASRTSSSCIACDRVWLFGSLTCGVRLCQPVRNCQGYDLRAFFLSPIDRQALFHRIDPWLLAQLSGVCLSERSCVHLAEMHPRTGRRHFVASVVL